MMRRLWIWLNTPLTFRSMWDWKIWLILLVAFIFVFIFQTLIVAAYMTYFEVLE